MSKNTNLSFLTDYITADITNGRIGINTPSPTVAFDVTGATKITGVLTLTSTISNGTYAYTLPSATGTLALTSALSGYLPLTGGTLTGALIGTSASFTGVITTANDVNLTSSAYVYSSAGGSGVRSGIFLNGASQAFNVFTAGTSKLEIASTGAATFSSSVSATSLRSSAVGTFGFNTANNGEFQIYATAADGLVMAGRGSTNDFVLVNKTGSNVFEVPTGTINTYFRGNVGIGTSSPTNALTVASTASYVAEFYRNNNADSRINITNTTTTSGTDKGLMLGEIGVDSYFYNYAAGAAIFGTSALERMRITAAGNVGIGTSSPSFALDVASTSADSFRINRTGVAGTGSASSMSFQVTQSNGQSATLGSISGEFMSNWGGDLRFYTKPANGTPNDSVTERMRITSGGNVGIRTTTPVGKLHIVTTGNPFTPTETGIIGGNNNYRVHIQSGEPGIMLTSDLSGAGSVTGTQTYQLGLQIGYVTTNDIRSFIYFGNSVLSFMYSGEQGSNGSERMRISTNGSIGAPNGTNIYNASDARLKQNVSTTTYGLNAISALNPVKFNWVDGFEPTEDGKDMLGFVAQEVQTVIPEAIESFGGNSITIGDTVIDNPLRVNEKFIIPVLVKAIQELSAEINILKNK